MLTIPYTNTTGQNADNNETMIESKVHKKREELVLNPVIRDTLALLKRDLPKTLAYHSFAHTDDVVTEVIRLALLDSLPDREIELLAIAAACHDAGFLHTPLLNEPLGATFARDAMKRVGGYSVEEIALVEQMIRDTVLVDSSTGPLQIPTTNLSRYLLDADLSNLGRDDFFDKGELLRRELGLEVKSFCQGAYALLTAHQWHTDAARSLRQAKKDENLQRLNALINAQ